MIDDEITTARLARLFDTTPKTIADLARREFIVKGAKRGTWQRDASISGYIRHLRSEAAGRGGEAGVTARERLVTTERTTTSEISNLRAQAQLRLVRAQLSSPDNVDADKIEASFKKGVLSVTCPRRRKHRGKLTQSK